MMQARDARVGGRIAIRPVLLGAAKSFVPTRLTA